MSEHKTKKQYPMTYNVQKVGTEKVEIDGNVVEYPVFKEKKRGRPAKAIQTTDFKAANNLLNTAPVLETDRVVAFPIPSPTPEQLTSLRKLLKAIRDDDMPRSLDKDVQVILEILHD